MSSLERYSQDYTCVCVAKDTLSLIRLKIKTFCVFASKELRTHSVVKHLIEVQLYLHLGLVFILQNRRIPLQIIFLAMPFVLIFSNL